MASNHIRNIGPMQAAPRCEKTKKNGKRCGGMAVKGRRLCRSHGGKAGAPKGNQNALKDGLYTKTSRARDQAARELVKQARALLGAIAAAPGDKARARGCKSDKNTAKT